MRRLRAALDGLYLAAGWLAGTFVFVIFAIMIATTVMRAAGLRTGGSDDVVSWLTAAAAFFGLAHTFKHGDFVRVGLVLERLAPGARRALELAALGVATAFVGYMAWSAASYVHDSWRFGDMAGGLVPIPIWIPQASFVAGTVLLFVAMADELVRVAAGRAPAYVAAVQARRASGDYTEEA